VVVNDATGERVIYRVLSADSGGEKLQLDVFFAPGGAARAMHVHPDQEERFEIVEGTLQVQVGRRVTTVSAGDVLVVPPGTPHRPRNLGALEVRCVAEFRPALNIETFFENAFAILSARGPRTTLPMMFELAELLSHYHHEVQATPAVLRLMTVLAAPVGRSLGYRPRFPVEA
jgi:mannose-6-phosphate isomerase-like protein (cupin superfamily)